jgi:hypothetical protein
MATSQARDRQDLWQECSFGRVQTTRDYQDVLALRHLAYTAAAKMNPRKTVAEMEDEFDARAAIVIARHAGVIIGSARVIFHGEADSLSYGRYFDHPVPGLPPRQEYAEGSRMCIRPDCRGGGLFYQIFARVILATRRGGRRYLVGGCTHELIDKWERCGHRRIGASYISRDIADMPHELMVLDAEAAIRGEGICDVMYAHIKAALAAEGKEASA